MTTSTSRLARTAATRRTGSRFPFRTVLLTSVKSRWRTFRLEFQRGQKQYSEETVHDLRVSTRRLMAALDLLVILHPTSHLRQARRLLKRQLERCGPLRDVQVELFAVDAMLADFPALQRFQAHLLRRERKVLRRLRVEVRHLRIASVKKALRAARKQLKSLPDTPALQQQLRSAAMGGVQAAFDEVIARKQAIDPGDSASIHHLRVAFKKFRYLVEALEPALGPNIRRHLGAMNAFQGSMGEIQDIEVLHADLSAFAAKHGLADELPYLGTLQELVRRRAELIATFMASADTVFTFWKPGLMRRPS